MITDLLPTDDQAMIADSIDALLRDRLPVERLKDSANWGGAAERQIWDELAGLGLFGLGVAADCGGVGFGLGEEVIVSRLAGYHLVSPSVIATMIAAHLGDAAAYAGGRRAAFANPLPVGAGRVHLIDASEADDLLLCTRNGSFLLPSGVSVDDASPMDETVSLGRAVLDTAAATTHGDGDATFLRCEMLLAAYAAGIAARAGEMAVEYAKVREQFGQPIGAFQAVKHSCADMALRTEAAYSQVCYTAARAGDAAPDSAASATAKLLADDAALANAKANIQVHGGMGFTYESDAHMLLKRAHLIAAIGDGTYVLQRRILGQAA